MLTFPLGLSARRLLAVALLALVVLVVAWRHAAAGGSAPTAVRVAPIVPASAVRARAAEAAHVVVDVAGAVRRPGLVHLSKGARVADAVARAGGLTRRADRSAVNFAALVSDGEQVLVPERGAVIPLGGGTAGGTGAGPISLSSASAEQLDTLPGIGPVTAAKIVAYRQQHGAFTSVDGLDAIPGIGPARIDELQGLVVP